MLLVLGTLAFVTPSNTASGQSRFRSDSIVYNEAGAGSGKLSGVDVSIHPSGNSAIFKAKNTVWSVNCGADEKTGVWNCSLMQQYKRPALLIWKGENGSVFVYVGTDISRRPYIYTNVDLRIDDGEAYSAEEPGWNAGQSAEIVRALRRGKSVVTSYTEWPSDNYAVAKFDLDGFDVAMEFVDFAVLNPPRSGVSARPR